MPVAVKLVHADWLRGVIAETGLPPHEAVIAGIEVLSELRLPLGFCA